MKEGGVTAREDEESVGGEGGFTWLLGVAMQSVVLSQTDALGFGS